MAPEAPSPGRGGGVGRDPPHFLSSKMGNLRAHGRKGPEEPLPSLGPKKRNTRKINNLFPMETSSRALPPWGGDQCEITVFGVFSVVFLSLSLIFR